MVTVAEIYIEGDPSHAAASATRGGGGTYDLDIYALNLRIDGFPSLIAAEEFVRSVLS